MVNMIRLSKPKKYKPINCCVTGKQRKIMSKAVQELQLLMGDHSGNTFRSVKG